MLQEGLKLGQGALETARSFGGYVAKILGTMPEDLIGVMGADKLRARRIENIIGLGERTRARLEARHVEAAEPVSLSLALPLLEAAADESREELSDLWARLLAAAMDPARTGRVRQTFMAAVKAMDPLDAVALMSFDGYSPEPGAGAEGQIAARLGVSQAQASISLFRLIELGCVRDAFARPGMVRTNVERPLLTSFGQELLEVLAD